MLAARRLDRLERVAEEIRAAGGVAHSVSMDVTDEASVIAAFDEAERALGPVDTVIANAGMNNEGLSTEITADSFDQVMAINVKGVFLTAREGARRMIAAGSRESGRGRVVLVSSIGAVKVLPGLAAYCASKAAVVMLGKSLAREWANGGSTSTSSAPASSRPTSTPTGSPATAARPRCAASPSQVDGGGGDRGHGPASLRRRLARDHRLRLRARRRADALAMPRLNLHGVAAIYRFELSRWFRTLTQSILSPVIATALYFVVFGGAIGSRMKPIDGVSYAAFIVPG